MSRLKIAVYTMAKNEAAHVQRYADTTKDADVVVVTDTGSTDGTPDLLRDHKITVHNASIMPWRFDTATNVALCNVPADVDVCVKLDLDEVLYMPDGMSWREEIERLWQADTMHIRYWYTWSWHVRGVTPATRFTVRNIHARSGIIWRHPGHAAICSYSPDRHKVVMAENLEIHHYAVSKSRPDYLKLLTLAVAENRCPRTLFYLGREHSSKKQYKQAIEILTEYLHHPQSNWRAERADAMRIIGNACEALGDPNQAMTWLMRANGELSGVRELWFTLLRLFCNTGDFAGGYWAGTKCLALQTRNAQWGGNEPAAWFDLPYVYMAKCAWHTGKQETAMHFLQQAITTNPQSTAARELALTIGVSL